MESVERLTTLLRTYRARQCMLFVGAGFSIGATRQSKSGSKESIPAGGALTKLLQTELDEEIDDLGDLAGLYEEQFGEFRLFSILKELYVASDITEQQKTICQFEWKEIYTTNFDNVLELSLSKAGLKYSLYTPSKRPSDVDYRTLPIIHVNGSIVNTSFEEFKNEITLTDVKYMSDDFSRTSWGERFRNDIITSPCIVFVGYSLFDLDVARILKSFEGMEERIFFVTKDTPSRSTHRKLTKFGTVIPIGTNGFASIVSEILRQQIFEKQPYFSAWTNIQVPKLSHKKLRDIDVVNFLMSGNIDSDLIANDIIENGNKIIVRRDFGKFISDKILNDSMDHCILTSNIGNGKSILLEEISIRLASNNQNVFVAGSKSSILLKEIPLFREIEGPITFIIDDAFSNIDVLKAILSLGRDDIHIVTSARTSQFDLQEAEINNVFNDQIEIFDLNTLSESETDHLIDYLDKYALWGKRQALSKQQKQRFVQIECSGELRFVILEILDSPNIRSRIQDLLDFDGTPNQRDRLQSALIISQLLNLAQIQSELTLLDELLSFDSRKEILRHQANLSDFSMIRNGKITIRSSIFSQYVLTKIFDTAFVIDTLVNCMRNIDIIFNNDLIYSSVFKNFSRFRFIETAIAPEKRLVHMINYFEKLKELSHCRENPLFWLQYAMGRLSLSQYREAERLFDVAYSYSKQKGYRENRHLNNQYARFLLESRSNSNEYTDYIGAFNKAHSICVKQMHNEPNSYNPYRVAQNYFDFVDRRKSQLEAGSLIGIFRSCSEVLKQINKNGPNIQNERVVDECRKSIRKTVDVVRNELKVHGVEI
jgi:SIR2-like domain